MEATISKITILVPYKKPMRYKAILHGDRDRVEAYVTMIKTGIVKHYTRVDFILTVTTRNMELVREYAKRFMRQIQEQCQDTHCLLTMSSGSYLLPLKGKILVHVASVTDYIEDFQLSQSA